MPPKPSAQPKRHNRPGRVGSRSGLAILLATTGIVACAAFLWLSFSIPISAQNPEPRLVRGDGYQVLEGLDLISVSAGRLHSCGVRTDGAVVCWGANDDGQTDAPSGQFSDISAGRDHSCGARTDGSVVCWGGNSLGQADAPSSRFIQVSAGGGHSCGLRPEGVVVCWGSNSSGQTGAPTGRFSLVSAGEWHSCGLRTDGVVVCWGGNWRGQTDAPLGRFSQVSTGREHSCGCGGRRSGLLGLQLEWPNGRAFGPLQSGQRELRTQLRREDGRERSLLGQ